MPIYDYDCPKCGRIENVWAKVNEMVRHDCGEVMKRLISASNISPDWEPYFDENLCRNRGEGAWVKSRQHRRELMKRYGLTEIG